MARPWPRPLALGCFSLRHLSQAYDLYTDPDLIYTRCVATPNGWTFVIPNKDSVSYGYLYNNKITEREDAIDDFTSRFGLDYIIDELVFDNYMAKDFYNGSRTILQGNMYGFIEPMEATSVAFYQYICRQSWDLIFKIQSYEYCNNKIRTNMKQLENIILWHYQFGSKFIISQAAQYINASIQIALNQHVV